MIVTTTEDMPLSPQTSEFDGLAKYHVDVNTRVALYRQTVSASLSTVFKFFYAPADFLLRANLY